MLLVPLFLFIFLLAVFLVAYYWGEVSSFTNPSSQVRYFGTGKDTKTYVVLGDSLSAGQGGDYEKGIAVTTAKHLGKDSRVALSNFSISGATVHDVLTEQIAKAVALKPDIVFISVGGNDVIQRTSLDALEKDLDDMIRKLIDSNCSMKIIVTSAPDVGTVKRFLPPLSWLASYQSAAINERFSVIVKKYGITNVDAFSTVSPAFKNDKTLYASDNFHPNDKGYAVWNAAIITSVDNALLHQPSHCQ